LIETARRYSLPVLRPNGLSRRWFSGTRPVMPSTSDQVCGGLSPGIPDRPDTLFLSTATNEAGDVRLGNKELFSEDFLETF